VTDARSSSQQQTQPQFTRTLAIIPANPPHTMRRLMSVAEDVFVVVVVVNGVVLFIVPLIFYHNIYNIIYVMGAMTECNAMPAHHQCLKQCDDY
jgi:hypothetical protein